MTIGEIFLTAAGVAIIVITIFLVPVLIQLRKVGERAETLLASLNQEVPPLLKNLNESAADLRLLTNSLNRRVEEVEQIIGQARNATDTFFHTVDLFKKTLLPVITKVGTFSAGLYAFLNFFKKSRQDN